MNCQNCGAPMKFDHDKVHYSCEYCTSIYFPEESSDGIRVTDEEGSFTCPVCKIPLVQAYAEKIQVLHCTRCRGILIPQILFLRVIQHIRSKARRLLSAPWPMRLEDMARTVYCPQCQRKMDTHPYGGPGNIVIDNCPHCMLNWLDYNELYRITHSPDRSEMEHTRQAHYGRLFRTTHGPDDDTEQE